MLPWILKNRPIWSHCLVYNVTMYFASQIVALDWQNRAATHVCSLRSHLSKCKQSKGVGPWRGSVTGLTKHNITIYLVPWHHNWSAQVKVITITSDTFLKVPGGTISLGEEHDNSWEMKARICPSTSVVFIKCQNNREYMKWNNQICLIFGQIELHGLGHWP